MAAAYSIELLSGSTDGKGVKVAATATAGTLIHTAVDDAGDNDIDLVTLHAFNFNADGAAATLTLEWGGVTSPDNLIVTPIPARSGAIFLCDRLPLKNGLIIRAFSNIANEVIIYGTVSRVVKT